MPIIDSPAEILMVLLNQELDRSVCPAGAVVGPADNDQQQAGVLQLVDAGNQKTELYAPITWTRSQVRCIAGDLSRVDQIGRHAFELLHDSDVRRVITAPSTGVSWLVHQTYCATAPSHHYDSDVTWESLFFPTICIGSVPVGTP